MTEAQIAAKARALEAIRKAEQTLAQPRPIGTLWEAPAPQPVATKASKLPQRDYGSAPSARTIAAETGRMIVPVIGKVFREELDRRDTRLDDVEERLAGIEAILAKAKGSMQ